jgi:hypothetical protein
VHGELMKGLLFGWSHEAGSFSPTSMAHQCPPCCAVSHLSGPSMMITRTPNSLAFSNTNLQV